VRNVSDENEETFYVRQLSSENRAVNEIMWENSVVPDIIYIYVHVYICICIYVYIYVYICIYICIQDVPGGMDKTSGEFSLC